VNYILLFCIFFNQQRGQCYISTTPIMQAFLCLRWSHLLQKCPYMCFLIVKMFLFPCSMHLNIGQVWHTHTVTNNNQCTTALMQIGYQTGQSPVLFHIYSWSYWLFPQLNSAFIHVYIPMTWKPPYNKQISDPNISS
jgi:hypothetical protein